MKAIARSLVVILVALIAVPALAVSYTIATAVQLLATTALIMGGTQHPLSVPTIRTISSTSYMGQAIDNFIIPGTGDEPVDDLRRDLPRGVLPGVRHDDVRRFRRRRPRPISGTASARRIGLASTTPGGVESPDTPPPANATEHFIVFGYSQSAVVASLVKNRLDQRRRSQTPLWTAPSSSWSRIPCGPTAASWAAGLRA